MSNKMDKEKTLSGNESIAKFMGGRIFTGKDYFDNDCQMVSFSKESNPPNQLSTCHFIEHLDYHKEFNWIMQVVERIETIDGGEYNTKLSSLQQWFSIHQSNNDKIADSSWGDELGEPSTKLEAIWTAVVEFVEWYNKIR